MDDSVNHICNVIGVNGMTRSKMVVLLSALLYVYIIIYGGKGWLVVWCSTKYTSVIQYHTPSHRGHKTLLWTYHLSS